MQCSVSKIADGRAITIMRIVAFHQAAVGLSFGKLLSTNNVCKRSLHGFALGVFDHIENFQCTDCDVGGICWQQWSNIEQSD